MKHSLFAVQIFTRLVETAPLREELHALLRAAPERMSYAAKRRLYADVVGAVLRAKPRMPFGHWDYTNDPEVAEREFHEWSEGTIRDATEMARHSPEPDQDGFMFLTMAVLLERKSDADRKLENACRYGEEKLWRQSTIEALLQAFPRLDFRRVRSDVVFLCPGSLERGVTRADLTKPAYAYVKELT